MSKIPIAVANAASFFYPAEDGGGGGGGSSSGPVMGKTGELWSNINNNNNVVLFKTKPPYSPPVLGCEVFGAVSVVAGLAGIWSIVAITYERYRVIR